MRNRRALSLSVCLATIAVLLSTAPSGPAIASDDDTARIKFADDEIAFEFVGQVTNLPPTPSAPLGSSNQYGYLTTVRGIESVFSGSPHSEATAALTFFNKATTTESFSSGPLRIIDRDGTTTIYLNSAPASFANPDSFRSGIPIQISKLHQQAIVDTTSGTFTAVFANTISSTSAFSIGGMTFKLGQKGQAFRATVTGHLNATPPPTGYFGGYAAGAGGNDAASQEEHRPSER
jgi:hypothetical protein